MASDPVGAVEETNGSAEEVILIVVNTAVSVEKGHLYGLTP